MIQQKNTNQVVHTGPVKKIDMSLMDAESIAFMIEQSRDGFYSNKELAPIREYSTNARDAHIEAGFPKRPIQVTLPSSFSPELKIRDFGKGLSMEDLENTYFRYWKSTKRNSESQNGYLGIGAKSGLAYSEVFTVMSCNGGNKIIATCHKNGVADIIYNKPNVEKEEDGAEITIPVLEKDIEKFIYEALHFFKYWDIRPIFKNIEEDKLNEVFSEMEEVTLLKGNNWSIRPPSQVNKTSSKAVMSSVPYNIDWTQVRNSLDSSVLDKIDSIFDFLASNLTTINFQNGSLSFTPNRESLQYNDLTIKSISQKLLEIHADLVKFVSDIIINCPNIWEAKITFNRIFRKGLEGFEDISFYDGNLKKLENLMTDSVSWNGIKIDQGYFNCDYYFDKNTGEEPKDFSNEKDNRNVLMCFIMNNENEEIKLTKEHVKIIASPKNRVVIQDTEKFYLAKGLVNKIFTENKGKVSKVYVLNLFNPSVKDKIFKEIDFETVPVSYVSQNIDEIKNFLKTVRKTNKGKDPISMGVRKCPYIEITDRKNSYGNSLRWNKEDVNSKNLEEGGYYVIYDMNGFVFNGRRYYHNCSMDFWKTIYELIVSTKNTDNIKKVYGIHSKTAESVWFKEAKENGEWTEFSEWFNQNIITKIPMDVVRKIEAYQNSSDKISMFAAKKLLPNLSSNDGLMVNYLKEILILKDYFHLRDIPNIFNIPNWSSSTEDENCYFEKFGKDIKNKYPLLFRTGSMVLHDDNSSYQKMDDGLVNDLIDYINLKDSVS